MQAIELKNKTILLTGVAGFIGSFLAKRLLETVEGIRIVGLDSVNDYYDVRLKESRLTELAQYENLVFIRGNIADAACIQEVFETYHPQIVVNLAAQAGVRYSITNPGAYIESNIIGCSFQCHKVTSMSIVFIIELARYDRTPVFPLQALYLRKDIPVPL